MKTQLQLSTAAVRATLAVAPSNDNVRAYCIRPSKGHPQGVPLRFARWIFLQFCIFAFLPVFAQIAAPDFTDSRDGQTYKTVIMPDGKRWMAENLRYRKGLDNPVVPNVPASSANTFAASKNLYYCPGPGPMNNSANQADPLACEYWGALYPFWVAYANTANTAVNTTLGEQGICPDGWHLPTNSEWDGMITAIGGTANAGYLLKDTARNTFNNNQAYKNLWTSSAVANKDSFGFKVLAAGLRSTAGAYSGNGTQALFWTSTANTNGTQAYSKIFTNSANSVTGSSTQNRADALSVRCVEGECKESSQIVLTMVQNSSGCTTETKTNFDTIFFKDATMTRIYNFLLSPALGTGWTYAVSYSNLPAGVSFSPTPTISATQVILNFVGLSDVVSGSVFTLKIAASNSNYCKLDTQEFSIKLIYNPPIETPVYVPATYPGASIASTHVINAPGNDVVGATGVLTDGRDGKKYTTAKMPDGQWWMSKNLEIGTCVSSSWTGADYTSNWKINGVSVQGKCSSINIAYGNYYNWIAATQFPDECGNGKTCPSSTFQGNLIQGICPDGWHLPVGGTCSDFEQMPNAGNINTWSNSSIWNGQWGGSYGTNGTTASFVGQAGWYWSSYETGGRGEHMAYNTGGAYPNYSCCDKTYAFSVRCIKN